jgi:hypothetical protein
VVGARERLDWLSRQTPGRWGEDFWPQPYEQLAKVLGEMGHDEDKRRVLVEKERLARRARRKRAGSPAMRLTLLVKDAVMGLTTGYGRLPLLALVWMVVLWIAAPHSTRISTGRTRCAPIRPWCCVRPNGCSARRRGTRPAFLPSLGTERAGLAEPGEAQLACYRRQPEASAYPKFNALMLSADAIIPGSGSGQGAYWSPDTRTPAGYYGKWFMYFQGIAGLALGLLAVAGFSGIVKSN